MSLRAELRNIAPIVVRCWSMLIDAICKSRASRVIYVLFVERQIWPTEVDNDISLALAHTPPNKPVVFLFLFVFVFLLLLIFLSFFFSPSSIATDFQGTLFSVAFLCWGSKTAAGLNSRVSCSTACQQGCVRVIRKRYLLSTLHLIYKDVIHAPFPRSPFTLSISRFSREISNAAVCALYTIRIIIQNSQRVKYCIINQAIERSDACMYNTNHDCTKLQSLRNVDKSDQLERI